MRVLVIHDGGSSGGIFRFLERLLAIHRDRGIDSALLIPERLFDPAFAELGATFSVPVWSRPNRNRVGTLPFLTPCWDFLFSWRAVRTWQPDVIVVSTADPCRMSIAMFYPRPVLYVLHTIPDRQFSFPARLYLRLGTWLDKNTVVTVSHAAATLISSHMGVSRNKVAVVYNSCKTVPEVKRERQPLVLTAGHLVSYKNPDAWLMVARQVLRQRPDASFVWLGDGELLEPLRQRVKTLGLDDRIILHGYVAEPGEWYVKAQLYFQPSLKESHGIAVLEAMAHGLPCVVARVGGLPESVIDGGTGFVCHPAESEGFVARILELLGDPALCERFGEAGRLRASDRFSEEEQEQSIVNLYARLMQGSGRP